MTPVGPIISFAVQNEVTLYDTFNTYVAVALDFSADGGTFYQ
jgi:hypothetical protein